MYMGSVYRIIKKKTLHLHITTGTILTAEWKSLYASTLDEFTPIIKRSNSALPADSKDAATLASCNVVTGNQNGFTKYKNELK